MTNRGDPAISAEMPGIGGLNVQFTSRDYTPSEIPVTSSSPRALYRRPPMMLPRGSRMFPGIFPGAWPALLKRNWRA